MTPIETLEACREMAKEVSLLSQLVESVALPGCGCRGAQLTGMPRGSNDNTAAALARVDQYEKWYLDSYAELVFLTERVEEIIAKLTDDEKKIIRLYYIEAKTDTECAATAGVDRRRIGEKRSEILKKLYYIA